MSNPCSCGIKISNLKKGTLAEAMSRFDGSNLEQEINENEANISFRYPWGPPSSTCKSVSEEFNCEVSISYSNYMSGFQGEAVYENGEVVSNQHETYEVDYGEDDYSCESTEEVSTLDVVSDSFWNDPSVKIIQKSIIDESLQKKNLEDYLYISQKINQIQMNVHIKENTSSVLADIYSGYITNEKEEIIPDSLVSNKDLTIVIKGLDAYMNVLLYSDDDIPF